MRLVEMLDYQYEPYEPVWGPPAPPAPARRRRSGRAVVRRWLGVLSLIAAVAGGGWLGLQHYQTHVAADQALAAAQSYVLRMTNIDVETIDEAFSGMSDGAAGEFRGMHEKSGAKLREVLIANNAVARGYITESTVKSASKDKAVVVLLVTQSVTNSTTPVPVIDRSRIRMTMDKVDGRWLASKVELL